MLIAAPGFRELAVTPFAALPLNLKPDRAGEWVLLNRRGATTGPFLEGPVLLPDGALCCVDIPGGRILASARRAIGPWSAATTAGPMA